MLVRPNHKKLILNLRDPTKVTEIIPSARTLDYKGRTLTVVPHRTPECRILRNLGFDPPDPMDHYYDWPIRPGWTPMAHQVATAKHLAAHGRAYCLNDLGTAKTLSALWSFDFLRQEGTARKLLIVAPLSTVERTWGDQIFYDLPHLNYVVLHAATKAQRIKLLNQPAEVYIVNHDGVKVLTDELVKHDFDAVIIDELSQAARNQHALWKALHAVIAKRAFVWGMTGTPIPNGPQDAWAQCRLLTPETVPKYYSHWRAETLLQVSEFKWVPRPDALDRVYAAMQPAIRFKREEVIDLPPVMYEDRVVPLTKEQQRMYDEMVAKLYAEYKGQGITAVNEGVKMGKLLQLCTGCAIGDTDTVVTPPKHRLLELVDVVEQAAGKVICFVPYRAPLDLIATILAKRYEVEQIHGGVSKKDRDRIFSAFQKPGSGPRVLVAQPAAMSHGLTLTEANVIVWFAPPMGAETYQQANGRITRPGQRRDQFIIHLQSTPLETRVYQRLKGNLALQGLLLDMFK